jgi:transcriptional regulator with XRE-family HTH domain
MDIGTAIKTLRILLGVKQTDLSILVGISQTSISQIENGYKKPKSSTIRKICTALEVPEVVIYVLGMQGEDVPESKKAVFEHLWPTMQELILQLVPAIGNIRYLEETLTL